MICACLIQLFAALSAQAVLLQFPKQLTCPQVKDDPVAATVSKEQNSRLTLGHASGHYIPSSTLGTRRVMGKE